MTLMSLAKVLASAYPDLQSQEVQHPCFGFSRFGLGFCHLLRRLPECPRELRNFSQSSLELDPFRFWNPSS